MHKVFGIAVGALLGIYVGCKYDYMQDRAIVATYVASGVASVTGMTASLFGKRMQRGFCGGETTSKEKGLVAPGKEESV